MAQLIIEGPTTYGTFFIRDPRNNVWDGQEWRGFGIAKQYHTFRAAHLDAAKLSRPTLRAAIMERMTEAQS